MTSFAPTGVFAFTTWQQRVGVEREYKWSFPLARAATIRAGRTVPEVLGALRLPDGYRRQEPYRHRQETAYLDDDWRLLDSESSLSVIINIGPTGEQSYLKAKQTIGWHGMRRDAVEIAEKVDLADVPLAVGDRPVLPVQYLARQYESGLQLRAFAVTEQERWKLTMYSAAGNPMVLCWDECVIRAADVDEREEVLCVEVETNILEEVGCTDLAELAAAVSEWVGAAPDRLSKSRRGAAIHRRRIEA